jgi:NitT/TauT family transport system substrate-binding protein
MIRTRRRPRLLLAALLGSALLTAGCQDGSAGAGSPAGSEGAGGRTERVTYLTAFGAAGRDAFAWIAEEKGYFQEANLEVTIELGKATGENLKALASGRVQFANLDLTGAMISADPRRPTGPTYRGFRAVLGVHQQTLVSVMARQDFSIVSPRDLAGKRIAAAANSVNQLLFPGYARLAGIDTSKIRWLAVQPAQLGPVLASGKADALSTFLIGRPTIEKATRQADGRGVVVFPYSEYLPDLFGNAVVTSAEIGTGKPDLVKRFREAMRKALVYTVAHPDEAAALLHEKHPETVTTVAAQEITLMTPSVRAQGENKIGVISRARAAAAITSLREAGVLGTTLRPEDVVDFDAMPAE